MTLNTKDYDYSTMFWTSQIADVFKTTEVDWHTITEMAKELKEMDLSAFEIDYFIKQCGYREIMEGVDFPIARFKFNFLNHARDYMKDDFEL